MKCNMLKSEVSAENERVKNSFSENQKAVKNNILLVRMQKPSETK